jgi:deazaflavin-dependent oxidoreductase (nitroreductase family)
MFGHGNPFIFEKDSTLIILAIRRTVQMGEKDLENQLRRVFFYLNKFFMVPLFRLGLGPLIGTPFGGYIMVLKVVGRKTGKGRYAPVNYAIENGNVYCLAGFGNASDWYRNLLARPNIEAIMPGGAIAGTAETVDDPIERQRIIRRILINGGFAGFFYGYDPRAVSDERLERDTRDLPVIRIRPVGIGSGASDPGGWAWVTVLLASFGLLAWLTRSKKR